VEVTPEPGRRSFGRIEHLVSELSGVLRPGVTLYDIVASLHPTPAVCGTPRNQALALIRQSEPFDRGWYAGPVGLFSSGSSESVVAIRSALIKSDTVSLYAGAGLVTGSIPEQEWDETGQKMSVVLNALFQR
jgi:menaquinone-specific isochorismate synthase